MDNNARIVLVTGSNSGIGYDTVAALAAASARYHVYLCSRSKEKGEKALDELQKRGDIKGKIALMQLDVTSTTSIAAAVQRVEKEHGRLDVLVNNAGIVSGAPTLAEQMRQTLETNTTGPTLVTEAFTPLMKKAVGGARLIYVSSGLGSIAKRADPKDPSYGLDGAAYRASKAALNMVAVGHAVTLAKDGVKVWTMCPGYVITNLTGEADRAGRAQRGALSSETSAQTILQIIEGKRDADVGKFVHKDGTYPW